MVKTVDLQEGTDPGPLWCAYIEGADAFRHMFSEPEAKKGFTLRPEKMLHKTKKNAKGENVRVYGEVRRGTFWEKADKLVSPQAAAASLDTVSLVIACERRRAPVAIWQQEDGVHLRPWVEFWKRLV